MMFRRVMVALGFAATLVQVAPAQAFTFAQFAQPTKALVADRAEQVSEPQSQRPTSANEDGQSRLQQQAKQLRDISSALTFR